MDGPTYQTAGNASYPSPAIWARCPVLQLISGQTPGRFFHEDFFGGYDIDEGVGGSLTLIGTNPDIDALAGIGGICDLATSGAADDQAYLVSRAIGYIVLNSGNEFWLEGRMAPHIMEATDTWLFGIGETALIDIANNDIIGDTGTLATESFLGFYTQAADTDQVSYGYQLDDGGFTDIVADVTESTALGTDAAALAADAYHRYGLWFDGRTTLRGYCDGIEIARTTLVSGTHPIGTDYAYGVVAGCKEISAGAATNLYIDWVRAAYQQIS